MLLSSAKPLSFAKQNKKNSLVFHVSRNGRYSLGSFHLFDGTFETQNTSILINVFLREAHQARKIVLFFAAKEGIARLKRQFSITIKIEHLCQWEDLIILCGIRINCQMGLSNKTVSFYNFFFIFIFLLAVIARTQSFLN